MEEKKIYVVVYVNAESEEPYHELANDNKAFPTFEKAFECARGYLQEIWEDDGVTYTSEVDEALREEHFVLSSYGDKKVQIETITLP